MTFTPRCSRSIENAKASLVRFNHTHVTSAHFVLGLLELHGGVAVNALRNFGVSLEIVEDYLSARRSSPPGDALAQDGSPAGKSAQVAYQRAEAQAARFGHSYVGTEHLLLAILLENAGEAADLFTSLHVDRKAIGFEVFREIAPINFSCQNPNT
jgi:ATP-dependent Clp protease ATP-binding subunit ClpC